MSSSPEQTQVLVTVEGALHSHCASCGEPIYWLKHARSGKPAPIEVKTTPENVMAWLDEGGYSCVLYLGKHRAYTCDEDLDRDEGGGWFSLPVAVARQLVTDGKIAVWDDGADELTHKYIRYRPAGWVAGWNMGQRPWFPTSKNQLILNMYKVDEAVKAGASEEPPF